VGEEYQTVEWRRKTCSVNRYVGHELADYFGMRVEEEEEIMPLMEQKDFVRTLLRMRVRKLTLTLSLTLSLSLSLSRKHTQTHSFKPVCVYFLLSTSNSASVNPNPNP